MIPVTFVNYQSILPVETDILKVIDFLGIAAFSISGAFAAMDKRLDPFGILIIAFVTAMGGGTLRDVLIGDVPPAWMFNLSYGVTVLLSTLIAMSFSNYIDNFKKILLFFDSVGLGFFTILGIEKGLALELHPVICITLGTVTGCFGGVIRDISLRSIPVIFHKEIYASACIVGGILFFVFSRVELNENWVKVISITSVVAVRISAVKFNLRLPNIYGRK